MRWRTTFAPLWCERAAGAGSRRSLARAACARLSRPPPRALGHGAGLPRLALRPGADGGAGQRAALRILKTCRGLDVDRFLGELGRALRVEWNEDLERSLAQDLVMTWDDVRALRGAGMEVGSHTATHRVLQTLAAADVAAELVTSRDAIAHELGAAPRAISYPVGRPLRRTPSLARAVEAAGYRVGFSAEQRAIPVAGGALDAFDLARVPVDAGITPHHLRALLAAPELCRSW